MKYRGIIFDLDGVLCSTDRYHYRAWKKTADRMHIYFDEDINQRLRGVSRMESLNIILERYDGTLDDGQKQRLAEDKNTEYRKLLEEMSEQDLSQEVKETLQELKSQGYLLAVGSSSKNAPFILRRLGLERYFDAVSDGNQITKSKPDPEVFLLAARYLKLSPRECLVVEDAAAGIDAAVRGGFDSAGLKEAAACGRATFRLRSFGALTEVLTTVEKI